VPEESMEIATYALQAFPSYKALAFLRYLRTLVKENCRTTNIKYSK